MEGPGFIRFRNPDTLYIEGGNNAFVLHVYRNLRYNVIITNESSIKKSKYTYHSVMVYVMWL